MDTIRQGAAAELWQSLVREACTRCGQSLDEAQESYLVFVLLRHQRDGHLLARTQALEWLEAQLRVGSARSDALRDAGANAGTLVKKLASMVGGKGGGRPNMAQAGGRDPSKIGALLDAAPSVLSEILGG